MSTKDPPSAIEWWVTFTRHDFALAEKNTLFDSHASTELLSNLATLQSL
jgi:hypothetical protein